VTLRNVPGLSVTRIAVMHPKPTCQSHQHHLSLAVRLRDALCCAGKGALAGHASELVLDACAENWGGDICKQGGIGGDGVGSGA
jgi:hypothetical protein